MSNNVEETIESSDEEMRSQGGMSDQSVDESN